MNYSEVVGMALQGNKSNELPVYDVNLPEDIDIAMNGRLDERLLIQVPGGKLHHLAAHSWNEMRLAAIRDKVFLEPVVGANCYRNFRDQSRIFHKRYSEAPVEGTSPVTWEGKVWWLRPGRAPAAVPGASKHGFGLAVDIQRAKRWTKELNWLLRNAQRFGWCWELQEEPWHLCFFLGKKLELEEEEAVYEEYNWDSKRLLTATKGKWVQPPRELEKWRATGLCIYGPSMQPGRMIVARPKGSSRYISSTMIDKLPLTPQAVITEEDDFIVGQNLPVLKVRNVEAAIFDMGFYARRKISGKIIGITGSAGKTTTVSMLSHILKLWGSVGKTQGTANKPKGIAWNLASFPWRAPHCVVEMSIAQMPLNSAFVRPDVAIFTNVAPAHLEYYKTTEEIARKKSKVFSFMPPSGIAIINRDMAEWLIVYSEAKRCGLRVVSFGNHQDADSRLISYSPGSGKVCADIGGEEFKYSLGAPGLHMVINSLACLSAIHALGMDLKPALAAFSLFKAVSGRGEVADVIIDGKKIKIIDEAYNANPASMKASIKMMEDMPHSSGRKLLIVGDMLELADDTVLRHQDLVPNIVSCKAECVILVGEHMPRIQRLLENEGVNCFSFKTYKELMREVVGVLRDGDVVLLKGSNSVGLHKVVSFLNAESS
ncbi:Mur ligase family protein [Vreelandella nigrificans]|nr:Mur ligase family protein [Halomonas nigrificans]